MKKELLIASALVSTLGAASVANAVTATTSGSHHTGLRGVNADSGSTDTISQVVASSFSVSLSETTDGGVGIASSFMLANEGTTGTQSAGLTLTFTDGSKLDVINAGNAAMKELNLSFNDAFSSVLICLHLNKTRRTIKTSRTRPGITPAAKVLDTGTLVRALNNIAALDGGINASKRAAEAARTTTNGVG